MLQKTNTRKYGTKKSLLCCLSSRILQDPEAPSFRCTLATPGLNTLQRFHPGGICLTYEIYRSLFHAHPVKVPEGLFRVVQFVREFSRTPFYHNLCFITFTLHVGGIERYVNKAHCHAAKCHQHNSFSRFCLPPKHTILCLE